MSKRRRGDGAVMRHRRELEAAMGEALRLMKRLDTGLDQAVHAEEEDESFSERLSHALYRLLMVWRVTVRPSRSGKRHPVKHVLTDTDERLVGTREILERFLPVHRSTLNEMIVQKRFPTPLKLGTSKLFWRWSAILRWLDERERHPVKRREFRNLPGKTTPKG